MQKSAIRRLGLAAAAVVSAVGGVAALGPTPAQAAGPYGPDTCLYPFVWREAQPGDRACVTTDRRQETAAENALHGQRVNPNGGPYGPNTCLDGWVWRDAVPGDQVCVSPLSRFQASYDNGETGRRRAIDTYIVTGHRINYDDVYGHADLYLAPSGAFTFKVHLNNSNPTAHLTDTACAVKLLDGRAFVFTVEGEIKGKLALFSSSKRDWKEEGRDARIAADWALIPQSRPLACRMRTNSNTTDVVNDLVRAQGISRAVRIEAA